MGLILPEVSQVGHRLNASCESSDDTASPWAPIELLLVAVFTKYAIADLKIQRFNALVSQCRDFRIIGSPSLAACSGGVRKPL